MDVLNPIMLAGLAGVAVPILVHLLSKRKLDVVEWGAMQFLDPLPKARRSMWIENLLLLLIRMLVISVLALALARPWVESTFLARLTTTRTQDVAIILDSSYSTELRQDGRTVADLLRRTARDTLDQLDSLDTVQIYDARETALGLLPSFTRDHASAREAILDLPGPTGASDLVGALSTAARHLIETGSLDREIVVITDRQAWPWKLDDAAAWQSFTALRQQAGVPPRVWVLTPRTTPIDQPAPNPPAAEKRDSVRNLSVQRLELAREFLMPGGTARLKATIRSRGDADARNCRLIVEVDGVPRPDNQTTIRVPAAGDADASFEVRLDRPGTHLLRVMIDEPDEDLLVDNFGIVAVEVGGGVPILLLDGAPHADVVSSETFFLAAALDGGTSGWLTPRVATLEDWPKLELSEFSLIVLANISELTTEQLGPLTKFADEGGGVLITLGDQSTATEQAPESAWNRWLPITLLTRAGDAVDESQSTTIAADSLQQPWQERFRRRRAAGFSETRIREWWRVEPRDLKEPDAKPIVISARYVNGDPCLITQRRGRGHLAVWTTTVDADWNGLTAKPDYVAWWHELLLSILEPATRRNVRVGEPLLALGPVGTNELPGEFLGPFDRIVPSEALQVGVRPGRRVVQSRYPGVYLFRQDPVPHDPAHPPPQVTLVEAERSLGTTPGSGYAVTADTEESDLSPLSDANRKRLADEHQITFIESPEDLSTAWLGEAIRTELSIPALYLLLAFLTFETWLTSRAARRTLGA